jgi:hypothetical protein
MYETGKTMKCFASIGKAIPEQRIAIPVMMGE